jgi:hypothetical protein
MITREIVREVVELLELEAVDYLLVGGIASMHHAVPRFTKDADFVVAAPAAELEKVLAKLPPAFVLDPQARMELFTGTMRWVIAVEGTVYKIELFLLGSDSHHVEEFKRRQRVWLPLIERDAWLATAEDLIVQKLRWARPQDVSDVGDILSVSGKSLDFAYIEKWCREHGTWERFEEIRRSIPEI